MERAGSHVQSPRVLSHRPVRPFLKWAGGKGQLLDDLRSLYPVQLKQGKIPTYYEPFVGSGAVFFDVAARCNIRTAYLYDANEELILVYRVIQQNVGQLLERLHHLERAYRKLDTVQRRAYYYRQRAQFNAQRQQVDFHKPSDRWAARAAQFIFLNRTCYNGLYRVNARGDFNVPAGDYAHPTICDEENLIGVHRVLQLAEIRVSDFSRVMVDLKTPAFVYFDPPYRPISRTASFNAYHKHPFDDHKQKELAALFRQLDHMGAQLMLSNSDPKNHDPADNFFDELYRGYRIKRIYARRAINARATGRGPITEIVVTNYSVPRIEPAKTIH